VGGLTDVVNSPMYATAVGLLQYGAKKEGTEDRFRIRDKNVFNRILGRMRKWFSDIS
jgi:cell division protein FtsA